MIMFVLCAATASFSSAPPSVLLRCSSASALTGKTHLEIAQGLLERTDVRYTPLASARPAAPPALKGAHPHANRTAASFGEDERTCRDDSLCRPSYRDGGNILVGEEGRRRLRTLIREQS